MKFIRPKRIVIVYEIPSQLKEEYWKLFKKHHYLSSSLNKSARCFVGYMWNVPVVFNSVLRMPSGTIHNAWREHRLVVLADYQGLGIGSTMSECVGEIIIKNGGRFFSKTANIKLGIYRNKSPRWRATSKNMKSRKDQLYNKRNYNNICNPKLSLRICFSHEYIGIS